VFPFYEPRNRVDSFRLPNRFRNALRNVSFRAQPSGAKIMKWKYLLLALTIFAIAAPTGLPAQQAASPDDAEAPLLTLDDAVSLALKQNRLVRNSGLEAQKYSFRVSTIRSRRLPQFQFSALGGELMHSFDFTFPAGAFGTYPGIGRIPGSESVVRTPARFATLVTGSIDEPLLQQYKIGLGIRATELGRDIADEDVRAERQRIAAEVRNAYFELVATQAAVYAAREAVKTLEEAQRVTVQYVAQKTVLRADALEVDARLTKAQYDLSTTEDGLATEHEHLNQLLGRDLVTSFRVDPMPEAEQAILTLEASRQQAIQNRPEIRQAHLKEKQAEYDRRLARAEYIPDLSISLRYIGFNNVRVLPANVATAGFLFSWEPFDWGRRRNLVIEKTKTVEQARNGAREAESQIAVEVGMKYRKWKEATLLVKASRITQEAAVEQFRVTGNKYKEKAVLIRDVLQTQAQSSETAYHYQQALSSYWTALADLHKAMGEE
jgi:outer membrane protein